MSEIRLSQSALKHNISVLSEKAPLHKLFIVLKDNAYGHGIVQYGSMCLQNGIKNVVVRDTEEALLVSDMFETILVLAEKAETGMSVRSYAFALYDLLAGYVIVAEFAESLIPKIVWHTLV